MEHLVVFTVADKRCAFSIEAISEIVSLPLLSRPPGLPPILEGFLNLRGLRLPVLRLERLFDLPVSDLRETQHILIVKSRELTLGVLVDYVQEIRPVEQAQLAGLQPRRIFNDCTASEVWLGDASVYLLAPDQLLLDEERLRLKNLQAMESQRLERLEAAA